MKAMVMVAEVRRMQLIVGAVGGRWDAVMVVDEGAACRGLSPKPAVVVECSRPTGACLAGSRPQRSVTKLWLERRMWLGKQSVIG